MVQRATLDAQHCLMARCDTLQHLSRLLPKPVRRKARKASVAVLCSSSNAKMPCSPRKNAATAASAPQSLPAFLLRLHLWPSSEWKRFRSELRKTDVPRLKAGTSFPTRSSRTARLCVFLSSPQACRVSAFHLSLPHTPPS